MVWASSIPFRKNRCVSRDAQSFDANCEVAAPIGEPFKHSSRVPWAVIDRLRTALEENKELRAQTTQLKQGLQHFIEHGNTRLKEQYETLQGQVKKWQEKSEKYQKALREARIENLQLNAAKTKLESENRRLVAAKARLEKQSKWVERQIDELLSHNFDTSAAYQAEEEDNDGNSIDSPLLRADDDEDEEYADVKSVEFPLLSKDSEENFEQRLVEILMPMKHFEDGEIDGKVTEKPPLRKDSVQDESQPCDDRSATSFLDD